MQTLADSVAITAGVLTLLSLLLIWRLRWRWVKFVFIPLVLIASIVTSIAFWYNHRPLPTNEQRTIFPGIEYIREVQPGETAPRVVHIVRIDLDTPGLSFLVTPHTPTERYDQKGRTTSQFLDEFNLSLAINADAFAPWYERSITDYYPHEGDPVNLKGITASNGDVYTVGYGDGVPPTVYISADNIVTFNYSPTAPYNAVSGLHTLMIDGEIAYIPPQEYQSQRHPRTAVAIDQSGRTLIFIVVDGRQPNYSEGVTLAELTDIAIDYGAWSAINLDGGGSTALVMADDAGQPVTLNSPIHTRIPGRERPIGNHLGVLVGQTSPN